MVFFRKERVQRIMAELFRFEISFFVAILSVLIGLWEAAKNRSSKSLLKLTFFVFNSIAVFISYLWVIFITINFDSYSIHSDLYMGLHYFLLALTLPFPLFVFAYLMLTVDDPRRF